MAMARPDRAWTYAAVCTLTSVAGGVFGYFIGAALYDTVGQWLVIQLYGYGDKVEAFRAAYAQYGALIILLKGLTPIPYKIVTITSGFAGYNILLFVVLSLITRGMRFFVEAFCSTATAPARGSSSRSGSAYGPASPRRRSWLALSSWCGYSEPSAPNPRCALAAPQILSRSAVMTNRDRACRIAGTPAAWLSLRLLGAAAGGIALAEDNHPAPTGPAATAPAPAAPAAQQQAAPPAPSQPTTAAPQPAPAPPASAAAPAATPQPVPASPAITAAPALPPPAAAGPGPSAPPSTADANPGFLHELAGGGTNRSPSSAAT